MKMYKDGNEILVDKDQMSIMLEGGWSLSKEEEIIQEPSEKEVLKEEDLGDAVEEPIAVKPKKRKLISKIKT